MSIRTALGEKIHRLRKEKGFTLEKLAELTDSSKSYIWELENRGQTRPSAEKIDRIARVLGVTPDFLMDADQHSQTPDQEERAFFRDFRTMDEATRARIMDLVKVWSAKK